MLTKGRTTLLVAHRRSTLALADRVAVLEAGRVVDVGTEAELTARSPLFRELLAKGVPAELHVFEKGGHGFAIRFTKGLPLAVWPELFLAYAKSKNWIPA